MESQIGQLQGFLRAGDPFTLQFAGGGSQTSCIKQTDGNAFQIESFFDGVACRTVRIAHNHAIVTKESVEQARFPSICRSVDYDAHTFTQNASLISSGE